MSVLLPRGPGWVTKRGEALMGELSYRADGKKAAARTLTPGVVTFDGSLAEWFGQAAEGDRVEVYVDVTPDGVAGQVRMADPPLITVPSGDAERAAAVERLGGGANPYTFIPTAPRIVDGQWRLPDGLVDAPGASHAVVDVTIEWSGRLVLRLTAVTPLLLPDPDSPDARRDEHDHPTYPVRVGPDGSPLIHGASLKGALRTAYETVTGSRYGVFRGHEQALAYRRPASKEDRPQVTPARVEDDGHGGRRFRLCTLLPVPLYDPPERERRGHGSAPRPPRRKARYLGTPPADVLGDDGHLDWTRLHGREVTYTTRDVGQPGKGRPLVDTVTLDGDPDPGERVRRGWLSITGRSIETKANERLFVRSGKPTIPVEDRHDELWRTVLTSYHDAAQYNDPGKDGDGRPLERSRHVDEKGPRPEQATLRHGDLVYLDLDQHTRTVHAVHPVMIGRLPFPGTPQALLDASLRPAATPQEVSPADRVFGWATQGDSAGRAASSGYRGQLRIGAIRCLTGDWLVEHPDGVTVTPSGTPKPAQFRFYTATDPGGGALAARARKSDGYGPGSGLRGRKTYWYPNNAKDDYWTPADPADNRTRDGRHREWQAHPDAKASQTATHLGWVRQGAEFTVEIFLDAVHRDDLAPLVWLMQQEGCALRLGAGKPHGFGAVRVSIDWDTSELRTGQSLKEGWLGLQRPAPTPTGQVQALGDEFDDVATTDDYLAPIVTAWRRVAAGLDVPIHYPRTHRAPETETYRWFVANEQIKDGEVKHGIALPHVLEPDQRLPYLPPARDGG